MTPSDIVPEGPADRAWWNVAIRIYYRDARRALASVRMHATILDAYQRMTPASAFSARRHARLYANLAGAVERAEYWRTLASVTRMARDIRFPR